MVDGLELRLNHSSISEHITVMRIAIRNNVEPASLDVCWGFPRSLRREALYAVLGGLILPRKVVHHLLLKL